MAPTSLQEFVDAVSCDPDITALIFTLFPSFIFLKESPVVLHVVIQKLHSPLKSHKSPVKFDSQSLKREKTISSGISGFIKRVSGYRKAPGFDRGSLIFLNLWASQTPKILKERKEKKKQVSVFKNCTFPGDVTFAAVMFYWPLWSWRRVRCRPRTAAPLLCTAGWCSSTSHRSASGCCESISGGRGRRKFKNFQRRRRKN